MNVLVLLGRETKPIWVGIMLIPMQLDEQQINTCINQRQIGRKAEALK